MGQSGKSRSTPATLIVYTIVKFLSTANYIITIY